MTNGSVAARYAAKILLRGRTFSFLTPLLALLGLLLSSGETATADEVGLLSGGAALDGYTYSASDWGITGLMQMPNARIAPDGEARFTGSYVKPYYRYSLDIAAFPWLEGAFRYTDINNVLYGPVSFSGDQKYKDRSFDMKIRLLKEGPYSPDVALTLRDFAGTGLFSGEFLAASRRFYDFDFTIGIGTGYGATRGNIPNPIGILVPSFKTRGVSTGAGSITFDYFHGPASLYGGIEYLTPIKGLRLKAEYDSNNYSADPLGNNILHASPFNIGIQYALFSVLDLGLGYEHGNTAMLTVNMHSNFNTAPLIPQRDVPAVSPSYGPPPASAPESRPTANKPAPQSASGNASQIPRSPASSNNLANPVGVAALEPAAPAIAPEGQNASGTPTVDRLLSMYGLIVLAPAAIGLPVEVRLDPNRPIPDRQRLARIALDLADRDAASPPGEVDFVMRTQGRITARLPLQVESLRRSQSLIGDPCALEQANCQWQIPPNSDKAVLVALNAPAKVNRPVPSEPKNQFPALSKSEIDRLAALIMADLKTQGLVETALTLTGRTATLRLVNPKYRDPVIAIGRAARVMAHDLPLRFQLLNVVLMSGGMPALEVGLVRGDVERLGAQGISPAEFWQDTTLTAPDTLVPVGSTADLSRSGSPFSFGVNPKIRQQVGGPNGFEFFQAYLNISGAFVIQPNWFIGADVAQNIYSNFDQITLASNSVLPHVRSDIVSYLQDHNEWINDFYTNYNARLTPNLYGRVTAGYYEAMYGGVGGELLYRPHDSLWAISVEGDRLRQRAFNDYFGFRPYQVTTGFINFYQKIPGPDLLAEVSVGSYLAHDRGATFQISREFNNGFRIGVFATKTNVSAADFGEGSFDKGFYVSIPLDIFTGAPSTARGDALFRPVTRDGGQRVDHPVDLYSTLQDSDDATVSHHWPSLSR